MKNIYYKNHVGIKHIYRNIIKKKLKKNIPDKVEDTRIGLTKEYKAVNIINE